MKKKKKQKNNKKYLIVISILLLIIFALLVIYLFNKNNKQENAINTSLTDTSKILIKDVLPISDKLGKKLDGKGTEEGIQGYLKFFVENKSDKKVKFQLYAVENQEISTINSNYIKMYLTDNADNPIKGYEKNMIPSYGELYVVLDKPEAKLLYEGTLEKFERKKYVLRTWLADSYAVSDDSREFLFNVGVKIK